MSHEGFRFFSLQEIGSRLVDAANDMATDEELTGDNPDVWTQIWKGEHPTFRSIQEIARVHQVVIRSDRPGVIIGSSGIIGYSGASEADLTRTLHAKLLAAKRLLPKVQENEEAFDLCFGRLKAVELVCTAFDIDIEDVLR